MNTGALIPALGLGTWQSTDEEALTGNSISFDHVVAP